MELPQHKDFSATATEQKFVYALQPIHATPELRAARQRPLNMDDTQTSQWKSGEFCLLAAC